MNWLDVVRGGVLILGLSSGASAQPTTGSIIGTIEDESGARLPGAAITVTHEGTGVVRTSLSNAAGRYQVHGLAPGPYSVAAEMSGFSKTIQGGVVVEVGRERQTNLVMRVGGLADSVTVAGEATVAGVSGAAVGGVVTTQQIEELPLNGRSFMQLATLQPGVVISRGTGRDFTGGYGATQLSIAGARPENTGYLMDGTNVADISDKAPSGLAGGLLGVDTVQEFSVQTHGYSAEFGRAAGGVLSAVTRSGTNRLRGTVFEFHRDSALDARNAFDVADPPDFRRDQFGATIGGPILRNRLFFFGSYEGLRDRQSVTRHARLPNADAHRGFMPSAGGGLQNVGVHPLARPYLDLLFPIPTGTDFGDGTAELAHAHQDPTDEDFVVTKFDWHPAPSDSVMARYSRDVSTSSISQPHPLFREATSAMTRYMTAQYQRIVSPRVLNLLRFAANTTFRENDMVPSVEIPHALYFTEDPHFGAINIIGTSTAGSVSTIPVEYTQHVFQLSDTLTWTAGSHTWKFGVDWQKYHFDGFSYSRYGGEFRFRNLTEFLTLRRSATAQADRFTGNLPGTDTYRQVRQHYLALFAQDDWRVSDRLTLTAGLRYDFTTVPTELNGKVAGLRDFSELDTNPDGITPGTPLFENPSATNFAPRFGATWRPGKTSNATIRGAWGVFYQPLTVSFYRGTVFRIYPYFAGVDIRQPAVFGPGNIEVLAAGVNPALVQKRSEFITSDLEQPYFQQWHTTVEAEIWRGIAVQAGYLGSRGRNLPFYGDPNSVPSEYLPDGTKRIVPGATIRFPSWGRIRTRTNVARSIYHGLIAGVTKRLSDSGMLQASYTFGNSRDTWSGGQLGDSDFENGAGNATDWFDPEYEFGPSNFDVRHNLVVNAVYRLPWGSDLRGVAGVLVSGWHISGVLQVSSGIPFTPYIGFDHAGDLQSDTLQQRPDQVRPVVYPKTAEQWFDPTAFELPGPGEFGNAGRNSLRAPGVKLLDLAFFKNIPLRHVTAQIRLEAFNVFNWVNLGLPIDMIFNADGTRFAGAGRITSTSTPARQLQIGLKLMF